MAGSVTCQPVPFERREGRDFFANPTTSILFRSVHDHLVIRMQARVQAEAPALTADLSPPLGGLAPELAACWSVDAESPHHFLGPSPLLPAVPKIAAYARAIARNTMTVEQIGAAVCDRIHRDFAYDSEATTVNTTPAEAFDLKRGVCQDFAHVMIVALRSLGIPAGYVSGFLRTLPPPGQERLEGADAMHAWVRFWCGTTGGWMELDPTNNIPAAPTTRRRPWPRLRRCRARDRRAERLRPSHDGTGRRRRPRRLIRNGTYVPLLHVRTGRNSH